MSEKKPAANETETNVERRSSSSQQDFGALVARHRNYFRSGATRPVEWRESQLIALRSMMKDRAEDFYAALWTDLRRNRIDADWTDVKYITSEANHALSHLRRWMKPLRVSTPLVLTPSHTQVRFDPLGVGLIIGTWNYPVMMTLSPLIGAISAGNTAVIKPSEVAAATAELISRLVPEYLDRSAFSVVLGAVPETTALLEQQWDHIFFTGGAAVAKLVMTAAAKRLTPVVLELGGKSPTIVHSSANLKVAAHRIAFGRWFNAGQTCTAPDYVLVFSSLQEVIDFVNARPSPLGLYVFSEDESITEQMLTSTSSGDAAVNDCTVQPIIHDLPFGGVGDSGMGKYHGEWGFRAYTNARGVLYHSSKLDFGGLRYPPYNRNRKLRELVIPS